MNKSKTLWKSGEAAPIGFYACCGCEDGLTTIYHDTDGKELPACAACGRTTWFKV